MKYFKEDHQYQSEKEKTVKLFFMKKSIHTQNNSHYKLRFKKKNKGERKYGWQHKII